jgi:hypothetical protein
MDDGEILITLQYNVLQYILKLDGCGSSQAARPSRQFN